MISSGSSLISDKVDSTVFFFFLVSFSFDWEFEVAVAVLAFFPEESFLPRFNL